MVRMLSQFFACLLLVFALSGTNRLLSQEKIELSSVLGNRVTFTLPSGWQVKRHVGIESRANIQLTLPSLNEKAPPPVASILANVVGPDINVRHLSDSVYKNKFEGLAVLSDAFDGENWRTMAWTAKSEKPFLALQRFGVVNRVSVEVIALFHLPENVDSKPLAETIANFNNLCASLKIDGNTKFDSRLQLQKILNPPKSASAP